MSTSAIIGLKYENKIKYVTAYSDGHIQYTGKILLRDFNTRENIEELFDKTSFVGTGRKNICDLVETIDELYINCYAGVMEEEDVDSIYTACKSTEHFYIFDIKKNEWFWSSNNDRELKLLKDKFNIYSKMVTFYDYIEE